ncbi:MAG: AAA family ATPase, partial [Solirubrobacterales bacterium]
KGRTVDFTNTVLIMTSNVGSQFIVEEENEKKMREEVTEALSATFKPEFLNRIDDVVIFQRLSEEDLSRIVELQVDSLAGRVRERGIEIELTDKARKLLAKLGYDPTYGARPLKRAIQKQLVDKLALKVLENEFSEGDTVLVDAKKDELTFKKGDPKKAEPDPEPETATA